MRKKEVNKLKVAGIISLLVLAAVLAIFFKGYSSAKEKSKEEIEALEAEIDRLSDPVATYEEATKEIDIALINTQIQNIGELATQEYLYTDAGKYSDQKQLFGCDIPFTEKSFLAKWDGIIKAGVKVEQIHAETDKETKEIIVHIPQAEILSHEIKEESFETFEEKDGLFNPIKIDDIREFDIMSKESMEKRAVENGLLDKAYDYAKSIIYQLIYTDLVKELGYTIVFE